MKRKSAETHLKNGTFQPSRHGKGKLPVVIPPMPADISPAAGAIWKVISQQLEAAGTVAEIDGLALRMLAEMVVLRAEAIDDIRERGVIVAGYRGVRIKNQAITVVSATTDRIIALLKQFGMTPLSRQSIDTAPALAADDELSAIVGWNVAGAPRNQ